MNKIISLCNLKGGVGKSTLAINIACQLNAFDNKVILIDTDTQATTSEWLGKKKIKLPSKALFLQKESQVPSLVTHIKEASQKYEFTIIDLPPQIGLSTVASIMLSHIILIPVTPSILDMQATLKTLNLIKEANKRRKDKITPKCFLVPSKIDKRTTTGRDLERVLEKQFKEEVAPSIAQRTHFVESAIKGGWIGSYAPKSKAHKEIKLLTKHIMKG